MTTPVEILIGGLAVALPSPDPAPGPSGAEMAALIADCGAEALRTHKIFGLALHLAGRDLPAELEPERRRLARRRRVLADELRVVRERLGPDRRYVVLRGPAIGARYPAAWPREYNDLDLLLRDVCDLAPSLSLLTGAGYRVVRPILCRRDRSAPGGVWSAVALNRHRADLDHPMYLDLTVGGLATDRLSCTGFGDDAWAAVTTLPDGTPVLAPSDLAVAFCVELMERDEPIGRDLVDFCALGSAGPDWDAVRVAVLRDRLTRGVAALAGLAARAGAHRPAERLDWLATPATRRRHLVRRAVANTTDRAYRRVAALSPSTALRAVERAPAATWFRLGLPVYVYPPDTVAGPLRGAAGPAAARLPGHRARVRPVATTEEVSRVLTLPPLDDPAPPLTAPEVDDWQRLIEAQLVAAAGDRETPDPQRIRAYVARSVVGGRGAEHTRGVRAGGTLVAAGRVLLCRHPLTGVLDRRVEGFCAEADRPDAVAALLDAVPYDHPVRIDVPVTGTAAVIESLRTNGFRPEVVTVRHVACPGAVPEGIRPARPDDADFVHRCLATAVRTGLLGAPAAVDEFDWVRERYASIVDGDSSTVCLVAAADGAAVAHGTALLREDRYGGADIAYIVDVFVTPEGRGRGLSHTITDALASVAYDRGVRRMESEVALRSTNVETLRRGLADAGWWEDRMIWVRDG